MNLEQSDRGFSLTSFSALTSHRVMVKVVDIGANPIDGDPPYASLLRSGCANVVGFEPNPFALARLNAGKGPNETYLPDPVGDGGRHILHICLAEGMTSLLKPNKAVLDLFHGFSDWAQVVGKDEVRTVRLDDVPETAGVDFLKLDIEGAELMVLRNAEARLREALVIQVEVAFLPIHENQPLFSDIDQFLRARGFMLHRFFPAVSRVLRPLVIANDIHAGLSQLVFADAVYVRDITRLAVLTEKQLLKTAALMHECYRSFDLVLHLLSEHDRRTGGGLAPSYHAGLHLPNTAFKVGTRADAFASFVPYIGGSPVKGGQNGS